MVIKIGLSRDCDTVAPFYQYDISVWYSGVGAYVKALAACV